METTSLAPSLKNIAPQQEYLLQASILDANRDVLLHRLRGLCDNAESNFETFADYEAVYVLKSSAVQQSQAVSFRVRHALDDPEAPDHIRYIGQAELGDRARPTLVRACLDVACSSNVREFLQEMGFKLDYDCVMKGYFFHKGRMKVTVYKIFRLLQPGKTDSSNWEPLSMSHLVELSVVAPLGQEQIGEDMKNFAEQLKPLVVLEKFDHRRLHN
ncbi:mediator of RNA polymerase II transcription subunit 18-like isoform X2 [Biomphalaria glabrata]|uniref:Mediator of RNA polymerase II transcription subunit 18 n=1 Tax=Biomphalaria glabrata TaxID=6526 RepID=A0A9W3BNH9_BIOGL|nr:mediator of RNA polymerase II transcription subunit 18-like isoform X2 [Biomphalaria glabrata]